MRGEDATQPKYYTYYLRFTPTCVGKTLGASLREQPGAVHPHMRGEDAGAMPTRTGSAGSPPHAWGRRIANESIAIVKRFTPTCVGKTNARCSAQSPQPVHPHMRGEDVGNGDERQTRCGSPPHAWGRRTGIKAKAHILRFTPTCVGKTTGC